MTVIFVVLPLLTPFKVILPVREFVEALSETVTLIFLVPVPEVADKVIQLLEEDAVHWSLVVNVNECVSFTDVAFNVVASTVQV